jgi:predicted dinucleotide-binding enzyme
MQTVAVIGAGPVGRAVGQGLVRAGHHVVYGVRTPDDAKHADLAERATPADAAGAADVVVLAVPAVGVIEAVPQLGLRAGQVLVDATNAVGVPVPEGHATMADLVASLAPDGVAVVKAFNTIGAEHLDGSELEGRPVFLPIGGDADGIAVVLPLAEAMGFDAVALGDRDTFPLLEAHAALWIRLAFGCEWGRSFGFTVAGR